MPLSADRCASLLADASSSVTDPAPSARLSGGSTRIHAAAQEGVNDASIVYPTARDRNTLLVSKTNNDNNNNNNKRIGSACFDASAMPVTTDLGMLGNAAGRLRALGHHPALPAVLRRMAKAWVRKWAATITLADSKPVPSELSSNGTSSEEAEAAGSTGHSEELGRSAQGLCGLAYLGNAAKCLAEARSVLSTIVASAEPVGDALASVPAASKENDQTGTDAGMDNEANGKPAQAPGDGGRGGKTGALPGDTERHTAGSIGTGRKDSSSVPSAAISTPQGRTLVMVQLEEACVRVMMGRFGDEARSEAQAVKAAAREEGVTPVQRCDKPINEETLPLFPVTCCVG